MQLEEQFYELDRTRLKRWLPWLSLWRAFRLAIHPRSIILGCLAILLLESGFAALAKLPFVTNEAILQPLTRSGRVVDVPTQAIALGWEDLYLAPLASLKEAFAHAGYLLQPVAAHVLSAIFLFKPGGGITTTATALTGLLLCLLVW